MSSTHTPSSTLHHLTSSHQPISSTHTPSSTTHHLTSGHQLISPKHTDPHQHCTTSHLAINTHAHQHCTASHPAINSSAQHTRSSTLHHLTSGHQLISPTYTHPHQPCTTSHPAINSSAQHTHTDLARASDVNLMPPAIRQLSHDDGPRPVPPIQGQGQCARAMVDHKAWVATQKLQ